MADNGSDTDVSSEHGDAWEHLAPSLPLDHPKAAAVMKEMKEKEEDEEWATNATRKYALIWCFKKWDAGGESFYQMMPNDVLRKVIAEALRHPLTNVAFSNGNTPLISFHPSALREFEVAPATAQFLKVNRKAACSVATVRRFLINTELGNFQRLLHILADRKYPQLWLSNHTWDGLDLSRVAESFMDMSVLLNELVANDKYGQLVKSGTTVRSPMVYPKVPWTMGPRSSTSQYFDDARSFASDSSELIDQWHAMYDEPPDWYVQGDREPPSWATTLSRGGENYITGENYVTVD